MPFGRKARFRELADFMRYAGRDPSRLVFEDELTGINNRRFLLRYFDRVRWSTGEDFPISLLAVDLDEFKQVNDRYGHEAGDQVLVWFASLVEETAGRNGLPVRYGGDEFVLVLPDFNRERAEQIAYGLLQKTRDRPFSLRSVETVLPITISVGVASAPSEATSGAGLFQAADAALYHAKQSGRDQVALAWKVDLEDVFEKTALHNLKAIGLTGRERELAQVSGCLENLANGVDQFMVIDGSPGMGKTSFLEKIHEQLTGEERFKVVHVTGVRQEGFRPYYLAVRVLVDLLRESGEDAEKILEDLSPAEAAYLSQVLPQLETEQTASVARDETVMREGIFAVLVQLVPNLVAGKPLVLLVDDLQYADEASLLVLRTVFTRDEMGLFVCGTSLELAAKDEDSPLKRFLAASHQELGIQTIQLRPLSSDEIKSHLEGLFPGLRMTEGFEEDLAEITNGNPLFISEIIRKLVSEQKLTFFGQEWAVLPLEEGYLPRSLEDIVQQKIGELDREDRQLLEQASTFGEKVSLSALSSSSEIEEAKVLEFLDRAEALGLVRLGFQVNDEILHFLGKQVLGISYGSIEEERRRELHERVGDFQEGLHEKKLLPSASLLAYQFKRSANQKKARRYEQMHLSYSNTVFNASEAAAYTGQPVEVEPEVGEPLGDEALGLMPELFRNLLTTVRNIQLYPAESDAVGNSQRRTGNAIRKVLEGSDVLNFSLTQQVLKANGVELDTSGFSALADAFVELLAQRDIRTMVVIRGVTDSELEDLFRTFAVIKRDQIVPGFWRKFSREKKFEHIVLRQVRYSAVDGMTAAGETVADLARVKEQALDAEESAGIPTILRAFMGAAMNSRLYPPGSRQIADSIDELHRSLQGILNRRKILTLATKDEFLLANGIKINVTEFESLAGSFFDLTRTAGLQSLTFSEKIDATELETFFDTLRDLPASGAEPDFWISFNSERGLSSLVVNERHYRLRVGHRGVFVASTDLPEDVGVGSETSSPQPYPEERDVPAPGLDKEPWLDAGEEVADDSKDEAPDVPRDGILKSGKDLLIRGEDKAFEQLVSRAFEEFQRLEQAERLELIRSCASLMDSLILGLQHRFAVLAADCLVSALASEDASTVAAEITDLLHRMAEGSIQFSDYRTATRIFDAFSSRRRALAALEDYSDRRKTEGLDRKLSQSAQDLLMDDLRSGEPDRQQRAAQILGSFGPGSIPLLVESIKRERDFRVRQLSAAILADLGSPAVRAIKRALAFEVTVEQRFRILEVIDTITRDLRDELTLCIGDANPKIRRAAFRLAERLGDEGFIEILIPFVRDEDANVAKGTIRSLANLRSPTAAVAVASILESTREADLAAACCQALGQIGDPAAVDALREVALPKGVFRFRKPWSVQVRATAVLALRQIDDPRVGEILARLGKDKDPMIRQMARGGGPGESS